MSYIPNISSHSSTHASADDEKEPMHPLLSSPPPLTKANTAKTDVEKTEEVWALYLQRDSEASLASCIPHQHQSTQNILYQSTQADTDDEKEPMHPRLVPLPPLVKAKTAKTNGEEFFEFYFDQMNDVPPPLSPASESDIQIGWAQPPVAGSNLANLTLPLNPNLIGELSPLNIRQNSNGSSPEGRTATPQNLFQDRSLRSSSGSSLVRQLSGAGARGSFAKIARQISGDSYETECKIQHERKTKWVRSPNRPVKARRVLHLGCPSVSESVSQKAERFARNICCYAPQGKKVEISKLASLLLPSNGREPRELEPKEISFLQELVQRLSSNFPSSEEERKNLAAEFENKGMAEEIPRTIRDAALNLVESGELTVLTAVLFAYFQNRAGSFNFPLYGPLEGAIRRPYTQSEYSWLFLEKEDQMVEYLLQNQTDPNFENLSKLFENMHLYGVSLEAIRDSYDMLFDYLAFCPQAPSICPMEKREYYLLAKRMLNDSIAFYADNHSFRNCLEDLKRRKFDKIVLWNSSHVFQAEIEGKEVKGYHYLQSNDVHQQEAITILLRDPMVILDEEGLAIGYYTVRFIDSNSQMKSATKFSSFYLNITPELLAQGLHEILTNPINDPSMGERDSERVYFGFHTDQTGKRLLSQIYINFERHRRDSIPVIASCFPVPYREIGEKNKPSLNPHMLRRSTSEFVKGSPLQGEHESPDGKFAKAVAEAAAQFATPFRRSGRKSYSKNKNIQRKVDEIIRNIPVPRIPEHPHSTEFLFQERFSSVRNAADIRTLLLSAVKRIKKPDLKNQLVRPISSEQTPSSYADISIVVTIPKDKLKSMIMRNLNRHTK